MWPQGHIVHPVTHSSHNLSPQPHPKISKIIGVSGGRTFHAVRLGTFKGVTEPVTDWITEAYNLTLLTDLVEAPFS